MKHITLILTALTLSVASAQAGNMDTTKIHTVDKNSIADKEQVSAADEFDILSMQAVPRKGKRSSVFCSWYSSGSASGYSIYRRIDNKDIGNAVWTSSYESECQEAAQVANSQRANVVCAKYYNKKNNSSAYSVYRISDGADLGLATIASFELCQDAVGSARHGIFCSTYVHNNETWWSMYDIDTGKDLGTQVFGSIERCEQEY